MIESPEGAPLEGRWSVYVSYFLAIGMVVCLALTAILLARRIFPGWDSRGLTLICILASIEAVLSHWLIKHLAIAQRQPGFYRLSEWLIFAVGLKLFTELQGGPAQLLGNLVKWPVDFPFNLLTGHYLLNLLLVFITWRASTFFAADLYLLEISEAVRTDQRVVKTPIRNLVLRRFLAIGLLVVFMAGLLLGNESPTDQAYWAGQAIPPVIIFFILGLALVSLTRFANLESLWRQEQVEIPPHVPRRWVLYSLLVIGALVILVVWLPTNYGSGLTGAVIAFLQFIYSIGYFLYALALAAYTFILRFFARAPGSEQGLNGPIETPAPPQLTPPAAPWIDPDLVRAVLVWIVVGGLMLIVLRQYVSFNQELWEELQRFRPLRWLARLWQGLKGSIRKANRAVGAIVQEGWERLRGRRARRPVAGESDEVSPRRLAPRQRIFFYYLAFVKRGGDTGVPRRASETPYEYARSLTSNLADGKDDVEALTSSFVEARYSDHNIAPSLAQRIGSVWSHVRRLLLEKRRRREDESGDSQEA